jgi:predicted nucleic acid-binding Zn ribbon protein
MPRYTYSCGTCGDVFSISHLITEKLTICIECHTNNTLTRVPSVLKRIGNKASASEKPGAIVKEFIEQTRQEVKDQKEHYKQKIKDD